MKTRVTTLLSLALACATACGDSFEVSDQPLQGEVGGMAWTFVAGETDSFLSDENKFFASLYASEFEACAFGRPTGNSLILSIPTAPGDYDLSLQRTMTFVVQEDDGPNNLIATEGRIIVDEVSATAITGGVHARFDSGNEVDGNFSVTICSE